MKNTFLISCIILIIACSLKAQSCDCTVEQVKNNSVSPCDAVIGEVLIVNSVTSFKNAINQANANEGNMTILIEDGVYHIASAISYPYITASNLIIRSASGNRDMVVLHGDGMKDVSPNTEDGLHIAGNNVTIADLTIRDVGNHGIQVSGHHLYVHNVRIQDTYQQMLKGATSEISIDSAIVQCSLFEYTTGIGPNYYIGGLDIHKGWNWLVRDNIFRNISSPSGSVAEHAIHFWNHSLQNTIERNLIYNCDRGIGFGLGNSPVSGGLIKNNMIYNDGTGAFNDVGIGLESSTGILVFNNTVYVDYQNAIEYRFPESYGIDIINNLTNHPITSRDGGQAMLANNITSAQSDWFIDLDVGDLHLASAIPAVIDQGSNVANVDDDIDKTSRPQGAWFDIGADELMTTGIHDHFSEGEIKLFPNPCDGSFSILLEKPLPWAIHIFNAMGTKIAEEVLKYSLLQIDIGGFPEGIYYIRLHADKEIYFSRLVLNRK